MLPSGVPFKLPLGVYPCPICHLLSTAAASLSCPCPHLQASAFLRLPRDAGGCVPTAALFRYFTARSAQIQLVRRAEAAANA